MIFQQEPGREYRFLFLLHVELEWLHESDWEYHVRHVARWGHEHASVYRRDDVPQFPQREELHEQSDGIEYVHQLLLRTKDGLAWIFLGLIVLIVGLLYRDGQDRNYGECSYGHELVI
ncbi:MAG: hypothetical protein JSS39_03320 [Nitrospira sp.]|nr:hypothetical protein [Nitrospira sp.]